MQHRIPLIYRILVQTTKLAVFQSHSVSCLVGLAHNYLTTSLYLRDDCSDNNFLNNMGTDLVSRVPKKEISFHT